MFLLLMMSVDLDLLNSLMEIQEKTPLICHLHLNNSRYSLENVSIVNSPVPVNAPTTRGGAYFSDKFAYKIKGIVKDLSIVPLLSKTMLGPNTDFDEIKITTHINLKGEKKNLSLFTNLTNSMQNSSKIELNMILVKLDSD